MEWEEIVVGQEYESVKGPVDKLQLVKYMGASGDFNLIHSDDETAKKAGMPGVIVQGMLVMGMLGQFVGDLGSPRTFVSSIQNRFQGVVLPGIAIRCRAKVVEKDEENRAVRFEISAQPEGQKVAISGDATLCFPKN